MLRFVSDGSGVFFLVLFGSATVVSRLPRCFFSLQTSKLFSNGALQTSLSLGFAHSPLSDPQRSSLQIPKLCALIAV